MKKPLIIIIILLVVIVGGGVLFFTKDTDNGQAEISCQDYDDNQQEMYIELAMNLANL